MNISYENVFGESVTSHQIKDLSEYEKIYTSDPGTLIKKIESYSNNSLITIRYYKGTNESEVDAVNELLQYGCSFTVIEKQQYGNYSIDHQNHYVNGLMTAKTRLLFDDTNLRICYEEVDLNSGLPDYQYTEKSLGEYVDDNTDTYCSFYYEADGSFRYCRFNYLSEQDGDHFNIDTLPWIKNKFRLSDAMYNYYLTATLEPPI